MVYFYVHELIGSNSKEAYDYYIFQITWLENNLPLGTWSLDNSAKICINGINIARGIRINNFTDAGKFCRACL